MFKPLEKVEIPEGAKRRIRIEEGHFDFESSSGFSRIRRLRKREI